MPVETVTPLAEIIEEVKEAGGEAFKYCYQCGTCDVVCPWNRVRPFSIRKIVRQASLGESSRSRSVWLCGGWPRPTASFLGRCGR